MWLMHQDRLLEGEAIEWRLKHHIKTLGHLSTLAFTLVENGKFAWIQVKKRHDLTSDFW